MAKDYTPSAANRAAYEKLSDAQVVGTVPPQAVELEEAVLGALMLEKDAIIYTYPNSNSFPAHLKMGNKLIASYYPRLFSHKRYQKEHTLKLDKEYAKWWLMSNDRIKFIERQRAFYLVSDYGLPFMYMVLAEVDEKTAKMFHRANPFGVYFYRSTKQSFYKQF